MDGRELSRQMIAAWNNRDWDTIRNAMHPDYTYTAPDGEIVKGVEEGQEAAWKSFGDGFPEGRIDVDSMQMYVDGNTVITEFRAKLTHTGTFAGIAPTGNTVEIDLCNKMVLSDDGRVLAERDYMDTLAFFAQLGVVEAP